MARVIQKFRSDVPHYHLNCDWRTLRTQLILRWSRLEARDLDETGPDAPMLANLIQQKYGIAAELAENYLRTMARTLPLAA
jgi:hypothetical protein